MKSLALAIRVSQLTALTGPDSLLLQRDPAGTSLCSDENLRSVTEVFQVITSRSTTRSNSSFPLVILSIVVIVKT